MYNETRFTMLKNSDPKTAQELIQLAQEDVNSRWRLYESLAAVPVKGDSKIAESAHAAKEEKP
jgi:pyruvate-ferredoxin/flavodoxin oxidoreductase